LVWDAVALLAEHLEGSASRLAHQVADWDQNIKVLNIFNYLAKNLLNKSKQFTGQFASKLA